MNTKALMVLMALTMAALFTGACQSEEVEIDKKLSTQAAAQNGNNNGTTNCTWGSSKVGNCGWTN